jgi:hypothetical protein
MVTMRLRHTALRVGLLPAILFGVTACGENVLGPLNDQVFALQTVDGQSLPAVVDGLDGAWTILADTIWFHSGSKWRRHTVHQRGPSTGNDLWDSENEGSVVRFEGDVVLSFDCEDGSCIAPDRLVVDGALLEMARTFLHPGTKLRFAPL